jgi:hypothetical protein
VTSSRLISGAFGFQTLDQFTGNVAVASATANRCAISAATGAVAIAVDHAANMRRIFAAKKLHLFDGLVLLRAVQLPLTWVVGGVDIVDSERPDELDLHDRFLIVRPNIMGSFGWDDGEGARFQYLAF